MRSLRDKWMGLKARIPSPNTQNERSCHGNRWVILFSQPCQIHRHTTCSIKYLANISVINGYKSSPKIGQRGKQAPQTPRNTLLLGRIPLTVSIILDLHSHNVGMDDAISRAQREEEDSELLLGFKKRVVFDGDIEA